MLVSGVEDEQGRLAAAVGTAAGAPAVARPLLAGADLDAEGVELVLEDGHGQSGQHVALPELVGHRVLLSLQYLRYD